MKYLDLNPKSYTLYPSAYTPVSNGGFTLFITLVVLSIVLVASLGIADIIVRDAALSRIGKDSQFALYAADTGAECALYWDIQQGPLPTTRPPKNASCAGTAVQMGGSNSSNFWFNLPNGSCARVNINLTGPKTYTSRGYNISGSNCDSTSLRKVERTLKLTY